MTVTLLNYRIMMRKKGKNLQIFNTQAASMDDAVKAALGVAHAEAVADMEELCIHEYGQGNSVRMLDAVAGTIEITTEARPPKDAPKVGQVIKSTSREAEIEESIDALIAKYSTGQKSPAAVENVAPLTQEKVRRYKLIQLACIEPTKKKGFGGRDG